MDHTFVAHFRPDGTVQSIKEHSEATAALAEELSINSFKDICYDIGIYHDIGKYQSDFQKRISGDRSISVEHSICGAKECIKINKDPLGYLMAYAVAGHHGGIPDGGSKVDNTDCPTLAGRLKRLCADYSVFKDELHLRNIDLKAFIQLLAADSESKNDPVIIEKYAFFTRYCFSCLVEADTVDTIRATGGSIPDKLKSDFIECLRKLDKRLCSFTPVSGLQKARANLQKQAFANINKDAHIYLMNMPTGSGKTLASMKCALQRAIKGNKKHIIYIIPYNSIIDQTVSEFETLFGESAQILRHQSSFSFEEEESDENYISMLKFAGENWNADIIVTTAVQFFESVYSNKRQKLRKFHSIAESVLVFDEAHLMPEKYLQPCLRAVAFAAKYLAGEAILLTATMPDYRYLISNYALKNLEILDLIQDRTLFSVFEKCCFSDMGSISDERLIEKTDQYSASLIVVNSKKAARTIYNRLRGECYHLSTYMTGVDRTKTIEKIKARVKQLAEDFPEPENVPEERKIKVVSTSLIEAGVDLDFCAVFRELTGLDSIIQAGGRCNREGLRNNGDVMIFSRSEDTAPHGIRESITADIIKKYNSIVSPAAVEEYYARLYDFEKNKITAHSIADDCVGIDSVPFRTYADNFRIIDSKAISVVVPQGDCEELRKAAEITHFVNSRKIQKYCCSVYENEFGTLLAQGVLNDYGSGIYFLTNPDYYDENTGIAVQGNDIFV